MSDIFETEKVTKTNHTVLIDASNILFASYFASPDVRHARNEEERTAFWRYIFLKMILRINKKFKGDETVLCIDGGSSWRKEIFKYYKANRAISREKSGVDWEVFFQQAATLISDISKNFPYKVVKADRAEADDVITILTEQLTNSRTKITIVSRDKDFQQLRKFSNVVVFDPLSDKFINTADPHQFLLEHILEGDRSDGIPNILSDDNTFVNSDKRSKCLTAKLKTQFRDLGIDEFVIRNNLLENYKRNKDLIELTSDNIPNDIIQNILYEYNNSAPIKDFMRVNAYLRKHKIQSMYDEVGGFF